MKNRTLNTKCLVCESLSLEPLCYMASPILPKMFRKVAICQNCGHIQCYPLFQNKEFSLLNENYFGRNYLVSDKPNISNNSRKEKKLDERLSSYLKEGHKVLDVGPGEAWAMGYFQEKHLDYFAVEPVPRLALSIEKRGGTVIGKSLLIVIVIMRNILI